MQHFYCSICIHAIKSITSPSTTVCSSDVVMRWMDCRSCGRRRYRLILCQYGWTTSRTERRGRKLAIACVLRHLMVGEQHVDSGWICTSDHHRLFNTTRAISWISPGRIGFWIFERLSVVYRRDMSWRRCHLYRDGMSLC